MYTRILALLVLAGASQAQTNTLVLTGDVHTGITWLRPEATSHHDPSGSCTVTPINAQYYSAPFFTDLTDDWYELHNQFGPNQYGFLFLYEDGFDPANPCSGLIEYGFGRTWHSFLIHLDANRQYVFVASEGTSGSGLFQVTIQGAAGSHMFWGNAPASHAPFCFGDGSGTACPCGNASAVGDRVGCLHSLGMGGKLRASGTASLAADTLVLSGSQMPNSSVLYFQGTSQLNGGAGTVFGDGLRCAGGSIVRIATRINSGGASHFPAAGELPVSVQGQVTTPGVRTYQAWYRNAAAFCSTGTFNLTNGDEVVWTL